MKRLGIDLGTSSLGWAILDDERIQAAPVGSGAPNVIDCGVVTFPEGMGRDEKSMNLKSHAAERRGKRAARRLIRRRKYRKFKILEYLIASGMCPMKVESLDQWKKTGQYPVQDTAFMEWLSATKDKNPYIDRKEAAEHIVDPLVFGRAVYHIAQRRGFKSSRKEQLAELEENSDAKKTDKQLGEVKKEILELTEKLGKRTLGQYFYELFQKGIKVRGRKTGRVEHYEVEFERICQVQSSWLSDKARDDLRKILFFQRPLRVQRFLAGWCELEKGRKYRRCLVSHPAFERFRVLCFVNNMMLRKKDADGEFQPLTTEQRTFVLEKLARVSPYDMKALMKDLNKQFTRKGEDVYICNYRDYADVPILEVTTRLDNLGISSESRQKALNALIDFQDLDKLEQWSKDKLGLDDKQARAFLRIDPSTERARYSLHAINRILPFLESGYHLSTAIYLAKFPEIIPDWEKYREIVIGTVLRVKEEYRKDKENFVYLPNRPKLVPLRERLRNTLRDFYVNELGKNVEEFEADYQKLYVDNTQCDTEEKRLPAVNMDSIKNPLVLRALTILRRLINTLREKGKIDEFTVINIELAHTVNSANMCRAIELWNKKLRDQRVEDRKELQEMLQDDKLSVEISDDLLLRYQLWIEQEKRSVYTGQIIAFRDMVMSCDIEHTLPRSKGGTNYRSNLTLCESHYNRDIKKTLLPSQCPNATETWHDSETGLEYPPIKDGYVMKLWESKLHNLENQCRRHRPRRGSDPEAYAKGRQKFLLLDLERRYWAEKIGMFRIMEEQVSQTSFMPRQLVDTGSITKFAVDFLKQRYPKVYPRNGAATAFARKMWGLQAEDEEKDRSDHTHHALDAIVIAALDPKRFVAICSALGQEFSFDAKVPAPYAHFGELAHKAVESVLVRHLSPKRYFHPIQRDAKRKNIRLATPADGAGGKKIYRVDSHGCTVHGSLHNDTIYGRINLHGKTVTVLRETIADKTSGKDLLNLADAAVDPAVGLVLRRQVESYQAQGVADKDIPRKEFWGPKDGNGTPDIDGLRLKKIRRIRNFKDPYSIRRQMFMRKRDEMCGFVYGVKSEMIELRIRFDAKMKPVAQCISLLSAARGEPVMADPNIIVHRGTMVLFYENTPDELRYKSTIELSKKLYVVRQIEEEENNNNRLILHHHRGIRDQDKRESKLDFESPHRLLRLRMSTYIGHALFEGKDFTMSLDGTISFK